MMQITMVTMSMITNVIMIKMFHLCLSGIKKVGDAISEIALDILSENYDLAPKFWRQKNTLRCRPFPLKQYA